MAGFDPPLACSGDTGNQRGRKGEGGYVYGTAPEPTVLRVNAGRWFYDKGDHRVKHSEIYVPPTIAPSTTRLVDRDTGEVIAEHTAPDWLRITAKPFVAATVDSNALRGKETELYRNGVFVGTFPTIAEAGRFAGVDGRAAQNALREKWKIKGIFEIRLAKGE